MSSWSPTAELRSFLLTICTLAPEKGLGTGDSFPKNRCCFGLAACSTSYVRLNTPTLAPRRPLSQSTKQHTPLPHYPHRTIPRCGARLQKPTAREMHHAKELNHVTTQMCPPNVSLSIGHPEKLAPREVPSRTSSKFFEHGAPSLCFAHDSRRGRRKFRPVSARSKNNSTNIFQSLRKLSALRPSTQGLLSPVLPTTKTIDFLHLFEGPLLDLWPCPHITPTNDPSNSHSRHHHADT